MKTLYDFLGALLQDDSECLTTAFHRAVKGAHPDIRPDDPNATLKFRQIACADEVLESAEQRAAYEHLLGLTRLGPELASKHTISARIHKVASSVIAIVGGSLVTAAGYLLFMHMSAASVAQVNSLELAKQASPQIAAVSPAGSPDTAEDSTVLGLDSVARGAAGSIGIFDECLAAEDCIDQYLWTLYQRTPKVDTIKVHEQRKVSVKKKDRTVTVTKTVTKLVNEDFTWKDPKAAEKAGKPMMDYVIGGMDRSFKLKLFRMFRAAEAAGLSPGITSAFRDDYRQSIASGLKAATDRSYHGGSFRGGYGLGLAADVVSVKGATRAERWISTESFWKWIDAHGKEFGLGRPYLDKDPPHLAPIDGKEYAAYHREATRQQAGLDTKEAGQTKEVVVASRHQTSGLPSRPIAFDNDLFGHPTAHR
jgi:hypothetical protein